VVRLLGLQTSSLTYDFVLADSVGGLRAIRPTQLSNTITSDYLRGLSLQTEHDLFDDRAVLDGISLSVAQGERLAQTLVDTTFGDTVFFTNSGAEAVETAIKTARAYHQNAGDAGDANRFEIITFHNAFHGRTMATISASNQTKMHHGFSPLLDGFKYAPFDDLEAAKALIGPHTAGILVEPIQGEGGIRPASQEFMEGLRALCDEHDLMLILDEVQSGVARTGKLYAYEHYGITPDIMATAKGIGGGFPLGACIATAHAARGMTFGTHGSTYGGNPLAMAAGMAVMEAVANDDFLNSVAEKGERLRAALEQALQTHPMLILDLSAVGFLDSAALGVLLAWMDRIALGSAKK
jgi:acetylornithine/N-succinyldiaminopimelate aminotransferase